MKDNYCSPKTKKMSGNTCFDNNSLKKIINYHEKIENIDYGGKLNKTDNNIVTNRNFLINKYNTYKKTISKKTGCKEEHCLLNTHYAQNDSQIEKNFRPEIPTEWYNDPNTWLSTVDIEEVLKQYEDAHPELVTVVTPIDWFAKDSYGRNVSDILKNLNIEEYLKNGKSKLGVVFNLDPHYQGGSHWTALFCDFMKGFIYYFDSYAVIPEKEIQKLMQKVKTQGNKLLLKKILKHTDISQDFRQKADFVKIKNNTIKIKNPSHPKAFSEENIIFFSKNNRLVGNSVNQIKKKKGNLLTLKNNIHSSADNCLQIEQVSFQPTWNRNRFQYQDSECGVFSIYFLEQLIEGKELKDIIGKGTEINDKEINKKRFNKYYRPKKKPLKKTFSHE
jgi:hypothetical protein